MQVTPQSTVNGPRFVELHVLKQPTGPYHFCCTSDSHREANGWWSPPNFLGPSCLSGFLEGGNLVQNPQPPPPPLDPESSSTWSAVHSQTGFLPYILNLRPRERAQGSK